MSEELNEVNVPNKHFIAVMFESKYDSTEENPKFYGKVYTYITEKDYKKGQVLTIDTPYGSKARVCVINENVDPATVTFECKEI